LTIESQSGIKVEISLSYGNAKTKPTEPTILNSSRTDEEIVSDSEEKSVVKDTPYGISFSG
jgi:hypothetical protein